MACCCAFWGRSRPEMDQSILWDPPDLAGWLEKEGFKKGTWMRRYFILKGSNLFWFDNQDALKVRGFAPLACSTVTRRMVVNRTGEKPYSLHIQLSPEAYNTCCRQHVTVAAISEDLQGLWYRALTQACMPRPALMARLQHSGMLKECTSGCPSLDRTRSSQARRLPNLPPGPGGVGCHSNASFRAVHSTEGPAAAAIDTAAATRGSPAQGPVSPPPKYWPDRDPQGRADRYDVISAVSYSSQYAGRKHKRQSKRLTPSSAERQHEGEIRSVVATADGRVFSGGGGGAGAAAAAAAPVTPWTSHRRLDVHINNEVAEQFVVGGAGASGAARRIDNLGGNHRYAPPATAAVIDPRVRQTPTMSDRPISPFIGSQNPIQSFNVEGGNGVGGGQQQEIRNQEGSAVGTKHGRNAIRVAQYMLRHDSTTEASGDASSALLEAYLEQQVLVLWHRASGCEAIEEFESVSGSRHRHCSRKMAEQLRLPVRQPTLTPNDVPSFVSLTPDALEVTDPRVGGARLVNHYCCQQPEHQHFQKTNPRNDAVVGGSSISSSKPISAAQTGAWVMPRGSKTYPQGPIAAAAAAAATMAVPGPIEDAIPYTHDAVLEHVGRSGVGSIESQLTGLRQSLAAVQVMLVDMQLRQQHQGIEQFQPQLQPQPQPLQHAQVEPLDHSLTHAQLQVQVQAQAQAVYNAAVMDPTKQVLDQTPTIPLQSLASRRNSAAKAAAAVAGSVAAVVPQPLPSPLQYFKRSTAGSSSGGAGVTSGVNGICSGPRGSVTPLTHGSRHSPDVGHVTTGEQASAAGASSISREVSQQRGLMADMTQTQQVIRSRRDPQKGPEHEHGRDMRSYGQDNKREYLRKLQPATATASDAAMLHSVSQQLSQLLPQHLSRHLQQQQQQQEQQQQHRAPKMSETSDILPPEYRIWKTAAFRACTGKSDGEDWKRRSDAGQLLHSGLPVEVVVQEGIAAAASAAAAPLPRPYHPTAAPAPPQLSNLPLLPYQPFDASPVVMLQPAAAHAPSAAFKVVTAPLLPPPPPPAPQIIPSLQSDRATASASNVSDVRKQLLIQIQNQANSRIPKHVKSNSMGAYHPASQNGVMSPHQRPHQA